MNETEQYIFDHIKTWVWSGFYTLDDIFEMMEDIIEEDCNEKKLHKLATKEFRRKNKAEKLWPKVTDCDRLDSLFQALNELGIIALQDSGYTISDGFDDISEVLNTLDRSKVKGYCFYHGQDLERAVAGDGVLLAFGDLDAIDEQKVEVGKLITKTIEAHSLNYEWDGTESTRINIFPFKWQRRNI